MSALTMDPNNVFRDFVTDGVPASGTWSPVKPEIRRLLSEYQAAIIALIAGQGGDIDLPNLLIRYTITGGTANAIEATPNLPVPDGPGLALFSIQILEPNTGPVTINGKPLRTNTGNEIAAEGLAANGVYLFLDNGAEYRLLSDQASAALVAEMEALLSDLQRRYLGAYADNAAATSAAGGNPVVGQLYWNTTDSEMRAWDGSAWQVFSGAVADGSVSEQKLAFPLIARIGPWTLKAFNQGAGVGNEAADTAALTAALESGESTITIDPVSFKIEANRYPIPAGFTMRGLGERSVLHMQDPTHTDGFLVIPPGADDIELTNFATLGPWAGSGGQYVPNQTAIEGEGTAAARNNRLTIKGVLVDGFGDNGVRLAYGVDVDVVRSRIRNVGRTGVQIMSGTDIRVNGNRIKNIAPGAGGNAPNLNAYGVAFTLSNGSSDPTRIFECIGNIIDGVPSWEGIDTHGGEDGTIALNRIYNTYLGIVVMAAGSGGTWPDAATRIRILSNTIHRRSNSLVPNARAGIGIFPWSAENGGEKARDITIADNWIRNMGGTASLEGAISIQDTFGFLCESNHIADCWGHGIETGRDAWGAIIGNDVTTINTVAGQARYFAFMDPNCAVTVDDNTIYRRGGSPTAGYYIPYAASGDLGVRLGIGGKGKVLGFGGFTVINATSFTNKHPDSTWT